MKLSHAVLVLISGLVWFAVGLGLLTLGLKLLVDPSRLAEGSYPLYSLVAPYLGRAEQIGLFFIVISLLVGYAKSKFVLSKSVQRSVKRIQGFSNPTSIANIYSRGYYILLGSMVLLGWSIKFFGVPNDIRGIVDVAVGAALLNGAILYFRLAWELKGQAAKA